MKRCTKAKTRFGTWILADDFCSRLVEHASSNRPPTGMGRDAREAVTAQSKNLKPAGSIAMSYLPWPTIRVEHRRGEQ